MPTVGALFRSAHPVPSIVVTAIAIMLGVGIGMDVARLALLGAAIAVQQFSVGLSNDWLDADRDRSVERVDKPVAAGLVSATMARTVAFVLAGAAMALTLPLGWQATLAHLGFMAAGWAYNVGLKSTPASVVAYAVGFGLLPGIVTLALPNPQLPAAWAVAVGALLGVSAHFANVLPDIAQDRELGVWGLPQLVGVRGSVIIVALTLFVGGILAVVGGGAVTVPKLIALGLVTVAAAVCWWLGTTRAPSRLLFRLILAAALLVVLLLGYSGRQLLA